MIFLGHELQISEEVLKMERVSTLSQHANKIVINGIYIHYKGLKYKILYIALHSETLDELVVYQAQYGEMTVWARPLALFLENITIEGISQPRFRLIG